MPQLILIGTGSEVGLIAESAQHFSASAPAAALLRNFGFTIDNACKRAKTLLA